MKWQVDFCLVSMGHTIASPHAAGVAIDPKLRQELEKGCAQETGRPR
ncbi:hypothetical protein ACWEJ6_30330 [Nonomuraea sp. NPDC004702]